MFLCVKRENASWVGGESGRIGTLHWSPSRHRIDNREPQSVFRVNRAGIVHCLVELFLHFASSWANVLNLRLGVKSAFTAGSTGMAPAKISAEDSKL